MQTKAKVMVGVNKKNKRKEEGQWIEVAKKKSLAIFIRSARIYFDDSKWKVRRC